MLKMSLSSDAGWVGTTKYLLLKFIFFSQKPFRQTVWPALENMLLALWKVQQAPKDSFKKPSNSRTHSLLVRVLNLE